MAAISTSMSPPRGSMKRFGSRLPSMSISGSSASAWCMTIRGRAAVVAQQQVQDEQRVALSRVDAERDHRPLARLEHVASGPESRTSTRTRATRSAVREIVPTNQRMTP